MIETLPGVFRLTSEEPALSVRARGFGRFTLTGSVPQFRDPGLRLESRAGDAAVPLAERMSAIDAFRALERRLPRGVHASATESHEGVEVRLNETLIPAARLPLVQIFSTDLKQRVRRLDDNAFELLGPTGSECLFTVKIDAKRTIVAAARGTSAAATAERIADRVPAGYRAEAKGASISFWKDADLRTIAA